MVLVVMVVAIVAAMALPAADPVHEPVASAAASEIAHAIRFAQREAVRTGTYHVAEINPATHTVRVYRLTSTAPVDEDTSNPVMHPVDKQTYRIRLAGNAVTRALVDSAVFTYGTEKTGDVAFGPDGAPAAVNYLKGKSAASALSVDGSIRVQAGAALRTITVDKTTGRVTL